MLINSSSSRIENFKNDFLVFGEAPAEHISDWTGEPEKNINIIFSETNTKFCLSLHYHVDNGYLFANKKEIYKFKANNKNVSFPIHLYDFAVKYNSIDKSSILNITSIYWLRTI